MTKSVQIHISDPHRKLTQKTYLVSKILTQRRLWNGLAHLLSHVLVSGLVDSLTDLRSTTDVNAAVKAANFGAILTVDVELIWRPTFGYQTGTFFVWFGQDDWTMFGRSC